MVKIISGGQTGVERAALDVALERDIPCGGWCPKGRKAEDGVIPAKYPLRETESVDYAERTRLNVLDSDGTIILHTGKLTGGTALTAQLAGTHDRPLLVVDLDRSPAPDEVIRWISDNRVMILNVAGPRETDHHGIHDRAAGFLLRVLT